MSAPEPTPGADGDAATAGSAGDVPHARGPADGDGSDDGSGDGLARWQRLTLVLALCALSALGGWWIGHPRDESFTDVDTGFLADMTVHHTGAIQLGFDYLAVEHDPVVGHIARDIVTAQSQEIAQMNTLLAEAGDPPNVGDGIAMDWMGMPTEPDTMPGMATEEQLAALRAASGRDADDHFTTLMIRHHAAGVEMAAHAAAHGKNQRVTRAATGMATIQCREIAEMNRRRVELGLPAVPLTASSHAHGGTGHTGVARAATICRRLG